MNREIDELREPTAARLLELWQSRRELDDPLERVLRCNGAVLAESCFAQGKPVFADETEVLQALTGSEMEQLLRRLSGGVSGTAEPSGENPAFDWARFQQMRRG